MQRKPCLCGHPKSVHQHVQIQVTPKPCEACGCPRYRAATKKAIRDRSLQGRLFPEPVKP